MSTLLNGGGQSRLGSGIAAGSRLIVTDVSIQARVYSRPCSSLTRLDAFPAVADAAATLVLTSASAAAGAPLADTAATLVLTSASTAQGAPAATAAATLALTGASTAQGAPVAQAAATLLLTSASAGAGAPLANAAATFVLLGQSDVSTAVVANADASTMLVLSGASTAIAEVLADSLNLLVLIGQADAQNAVPLPVVEAPTSIGVNWRDRLDRMRRRLERKRPEHVSRVAVAVATLPLYGEARAEHRHFAEGRATLILIGESAAVKLDDFDAEEDALLAAMLEALNRQAA